MKHVKSERLKKLETELTDLEQWLKLGLVPKKDMDKHKESGEAEEYVTPKRPAARAGYNEMPTIPDIDIGETMGGSETGFDMETDAIEVDNTIEEHEEEDEATEQEEEDEEDESYFSDRNRWRRGGIVDPDANDW